MNTIDDQARLEGQVRDALAARAAEITPADIGDLRLPGDRASRRAGTRRAGARRGRWLVPLAAAASVIAVTGGAILITGAVTGHDHGHAAAGRHNSGQHPRGQHPRGQHPRGQHRPAPPTIDGLPPYFVMVGGPVAGAAGEQATASTSGVPVQIMVTATGKVAATASLPAGHPLLAGGPDGTFFAAVGDGAGVGGGPAVFYSITLPATGTTARVTRLPVTSSGGLSFLAASPDGRELAFATYVQHGDLGLVQRLTVASVAAGGARTWTMPASSTDSISSLGWLGNDRTLAIGLADGPGGGSLRFLDTTAPGSDLLDSRQVLALDNPAGQFNALTVSPDGRIAVGTEQYPAGLGAIAGRPAEQGDVVAFALRTGQDSLRYRPGGVWDRPYRKTLPSNCNDPLWLSSSARRILLMCTRPRPEDGAPEIPTIPRFLLLDGTHVTELPWLVRFAPGMLAFGTTRR
ncbi:MAG TPA: hypothetical protein VGG25_13010 [Streptosporangiaceae bacterium]|jgi:hypothetical protein